MRRILVTAGLAAAALAFGVASASATNECRGLQTCVPVQGPWVIVPTGSSVPRPRAEFVLSCPKGFVAGGLDAELTHRTIDMSFLGAIGAPVNPGITTARDVVFLASFVGSSARAPSFRPHLGCMPTPGGGGRVPTSASVVPPGKPTVLHIKNVMLVPGTQRVVVGCAANERLVGASSAVGFYSYGPPGPILADGVSAKQSVARGRVVVTARMSGTLYRARPVVQAVAVCAGGS